MPGGKVLSVKTIVRTGLFTVLLLRINETAHDTGGSTSWSRALRDAQCCAVREGRVRLQTIKSFFEKSSCVSKYFE